MQRIKRFIPSSVKQKLKEIAGYEPTSEHVLGSLNPATMQLAEQQRYGYAREHFHVFGYCRLSGFFTSLESNALADSLDQLLNEDKGVSTDQPVPFLGLPVERSRGIQDVLLVDSLAAAIEAVVGPFWYISSDASRGQDVFPLHRDTFFSPPCIKAFIPLETCTFKYLPGSHWYHDQYASLSGKCLSTWDTGAESKIAADTLVYDHTQGRGLLDHHDIKSNPPVSSIALKSGDVFLFQQNGIHGLNALESSNKFLAFSFFPSPVNAAAFGLTRQDHLDKILQSVISLGVADSKLAAHRQIKADKISFDYKFSSHDFASICQRSPHWKRCMGFSRFSSEDWEYIASVYSYNFLETLRDPL
jgi:hypothetical protein